MKIKKSILIVILAITVMMFATYTYAETNQTTNPEEQIHIDEYIEVKQGTTIKEFIENEKQRRLKEWYKDEQDQGYIVEFGNAVVYGVDGSTEADLQEAHKKAPLQESDLVRTNMEVEIGVSFYKMVDGEKKERTYCW